VDNLTLTCSCKTSMVPVETLGKGHFRCPKCRTRVHVSTPFSGKIDVCRLSLGFGRRCSNEVAGPAMGLCLEHAQGAAEWVLRDAGRREEMIDKASASERFVAVRDGINERHAEYHRARQESALLLPSFVYYVRLRPGCIKIGRSIDVLGRMASFRIWDKDELLAVEPGGHSMEKQRHRQFAHIRQRSDLEEFDEAPDLMEHIAAIRSGHGEPWQAIDRMRSLAHRKKERAEGRID